MDQPDMVATTVARLHVGDTITITLNGPPDPIEPQEKVIKDDGTITLPAIGSVMAAGMTPGALEDLIHAKYVPAVYTHLTVTVKASNERVYYVAGEVHRPGVNMYSGALTVSKAIAASGDVTDFADYGDITLTRANGDRYKLNLRRILAGHDQDPPVFPGDQIVVGRRTW